MSGVWVSSERTRGQPTHGLKEGNMFTQQHVRLLGPERQLFLDDELLDELFGFRRRFGRIERHPDNPVLHAEYPWEGRHPTVGTVLPDGEGGYRMCYGSWVNPAETKDVQRFFVGGAVSCYATSADGLRWERPGLGIHPWGAQAQTNILSLGTEAGTPVEGPDETDPARRYRRLVLSQDRMSWNLQYSADLLHWSEMRFLWKKHDELIRDFATLVWDPYGKRWLMPCKLCRRWGHHWPDWSIRRCLGLTTSEDGEHWDYPELILAPDALDDQQSRERNARDRTRLSAWRPEEAWCDFQGMIIWPYEGLYLGWVDVNDVCGLSPYSNNDSLVRTQLVVSRDLRHWTRVCDRQTFFDLSPNGAWDSRMLLGASNRLIQQGDELRIYYNGYACSHADEASFGHAPAPALWGGIGLATLRRDGWVALDIGQVGTPGYFRTKTLSFTGSTLCLNLDSRWRGWVRVELCEPHGEPIPGFGQNDCDPITVDSTRHVVTWHGSSDISKLQGQALKLRVFGNCARVYAFWFEE